MPIHPFKILFSCVYSHTPVRAMLTDKSRLSNPEVDKIIRKTWARFADRSKSRDFSLFSESLCSLIRYTETEKGAELTLGRTSYEEYLGTNLKNPWIHGKYGNEYLANPLGVNALLITSDRKVVLGTRKKNLAVDHSMADVFGGYFFITPEAEREPEVDLFEEAKYKVLRFFNIRPDNITEVTCLGLIRHRTTLKPEILFTAAVNVSSADLLEKNAQRAPDQKYTDWVALDDDADTLKDYYIRNKDRMTVALMASLSLYASRRKYWSTIEGMPRFSSFRKIPPKVALVLGGGFAKGGAHIGVFKALEHIGLKIDLIVGNSIGGLMGAIYAAKGSYEWLEQAALEFKWKTVADWSFPRLSLFKGEKLMQFLETALVYPSFDDLSVPLAVIATDLVTGDEMVLCGQSLYDRRKALKTAESPGVEFMVAPLPQSVRASCAVPGIFSPVTLGGRLLCDGMVLDNVPVKIARALGAEFIIAVDLSYEGRSGEATNIISILLRTQALMGAAMSRFEMTGADVVIKPDLSGQRFNDFSHTPAVIQNGYEAAMSAVEEIQRRFEKKMRLKFFGFSSNA